MNITLHKTKHKTLSPVWMSDKLLKLIVSEKGAARRAGQGAGAGGIELCTNGASEEQMHRERFRP